MPEIDNSPEAQQQRLRRIQHAAWREGHDLCCDFGPECEYHESPYAPPKRLQGESSSA